MGNNHQIKRQRILALDLLRGAFLVAIIVNHLVGGPSLFHLFSGGGKMLSSPAEGFFAISGMLVGYIYAPRIVNSFWKASKKIWKRAGLLYILGVLYTFVFTAWVLIFPNSDMPPIWSKSPLMYFINTLLGRYAYGFTDFLPRYAWFMLLSPIALWFITKGKSWFIFFSSVVIYITLHKNLHFLPFSSWQLIFFLSMIIGYYLPQIINYANKLSNLSRELIYSVFQIIGMSTFILSSIAFVAMPMMGLSPSDGFQHFITKYYHLFDKNSLGIGRLILGSFWFIWLFLTFRRHEKKIDKFTFGILKAFGQNSLYTYCTHAIVICVLSTLFSGLHLPIIGSTLFSALVIAFIYLIVYNNLARKRRKQNFLLQSQVMNSST